MTPCAAASHECMHNTAARFVIRLSCRAFSSDPRLAPGSLQQLRPKQRPPARLFLGMSNRHTPAALQTEPHTYCKGKLLMNAQKHPPAKPALGPVTSSSHILKAKHAHAGPAPQAIKIPWQGPPLRAWHTTGSGLQSSHSSTSACWCHTSCGAEAAF